MSNPDIYRNFAELRESEPAGAWRIRKRVRRKSSVLIIAPHGGQIEPGTSALAKAIAGTSYNLYLFEGHKPPGENQALHITSHRFDETYALAIAAKCHTVLGVHGCGGVWTVHVGGRNLELRAALAAALKSTGLRVQANGPKFKAENPLNICNRGSTGRGVQIELTRDMRRSPAMRARLVKIIRVVIEDHLKQLAASAVRLHGN
jgi:phage replication-related protein YjqB (UPF0714/DUF867 family)